MEFGQPGTLGRHVLLVGSRQWGGIGAALNQHMEAPTALETGLKQPCVQYYLVKVKLICK